MAEKKEDPKALLRAYRAMIEVALRFVPLQQKDTCRNNMMAVAMGEVHSDG